MGFFDWLLDGPPRPDDDELGDIRPALGKLIKRALKDGGVGFDLKIWDCVLNDIPVGSWRFTVERIADFKEPTEPERTKRV